MKEIAIYGKGGIGKSTVAANISASLAGLGRRVLQIGCDPKHDSTRLLTHGREITTALDYIRVTNPLDYKIEDILFQGYGGIGCVEAGGPEPGVGCAGRGIITTFELLDSFKIKENYDTILYDVLGDVVCGGFAVPLRREYAEAVFIVTSGEFMSLYAANNILRGIRNYDGEGSRVAGLLYNSRNFEGEDERVRLFARAVDLPVLLRVPRSDSFAEAEAENLTVVESGKDAALKRLFLEFAEKIAEGFPLHRAKPLTDRELEEALLVSGVRAAPGKQAPKRGAREEDEKAAPPAIDLADPNRYLSKNVIRNEPLHGCAFNGAASTAAQIRDAVVLAHAPVNCIYITGQTISSPGRRSIYERGILMPNALSPNFDSTEMTESDVIFGGTEKLFQTVKRLKAQKPRAVIIVSACPAGIIGDDIDKAKALAEPDMPIVTIKADGNMSGDYLQGMLMSYTSLARQIIKKDVPVIPNTVNIVFEKIILKNTDLNYRFVGGVLERLGVGINCRFLYDTTFDKLRNFCSAELNLLANRDYTGALLEDFFKREYHAAFFEHEFPVGIDETETWVRDLAARFGQPGAGESILAEQRRLYDAEAEALRPALSGKRLMIITYNHELDWVLRAAADVGIETVKIGVLNFSQDEGFRTKLTLKCPVEKEYDRENRAADIARYRPDILLTNYAYSVTGDVPVSDTIPMCPDIGPDAGLKLLRRWARLLELNLKEGWRADEQLFRKYYS